MNNGYEKYIPIISKLIILGAVILSIRYYGATIIIALLPFILAWGIASLLEPIIKLFKRKLKTPHQLAIALSVALFVLAVAILVAILGGIIAVQLVDFYLKVPEYSNRLLANSDFIIERAQNLYTLIPPDIAYSLQEGLNSLISFASSSIMLVVGTLLNIITIVPELFVFIIVTIIATFFIARDKEIIIDFITNQIPDSVMDKYKVIRHDLNVALIGYIKAQLILMIFTFFISLTGLIIIGSDFAFLIAFTASFLDALPILGTGTVYVPMILFHLLKGNIPLAIYSAILYGVVITVRQMMEPKVLSTQIGVNPLSTLIAMYVGFRLFGVFGLIAGPIMLIMIPSLQKIGILPKWREKTQ